MEIFIGRQKEDSRLAVTVGTKTALIGDSGCVPKSVSRERHCKITVDADGRMTLENLNPGNITMAGGVAVSRIRINKTDDISLGRDGYKLKIDTVLEVARKLFPSQGRTTGVTKSPQPQIYSIAKLEKVYNDYQNELEAYNIKKTETTGGTVCFRSFIDDVYRCIFHSRCRRLSRMALRNSLYPCRHLSYNKVYRSGKGHTDTEGHTQTI
ncbi:FHA domain-containing protein [Xylanibacter caecicola]|uniref:FHA domain-containing protein n=1 Tax=Xylanibacter caecicola TaxID=2736294 RepID=UPI00258D8833|nr:FHA domain-containing protein [Xylanibacter caecicola]